MAVRTTSRFRQSGALAASQVALIGVLVIILAGGVVLLSGIWPAEEAVPDPTPVVTAPEPKLPMPEPEPPVAPASPAEPVILEPVAEPLPRLEESDDAVRDAIGSIPLGNAGQQYLMPGNIIERSASLIYLMAQGDVPYKLLPVARPKGAFPISDDGAQVIVDPAGFSRYDAMGQWVQSLDIDALLVALDWFLPLFREAWSYYGEDEDAFDPAVLATLDVIINTPQIDLSEARLIRKEAIWVYEDPAIEALAPVQKQLLRMGPENAAIIRAKGEEARALWLQKMTDGN